MAFQGHAQEMPPPGGYSSIPYGRVPIKKGFKSMTWIGAYIALNIVGFYSFSYTTNVIYREEIENRSSRMAIFPFLLAERDRAYLKQCRQNRDDEAELMKDVKGWEVGTWYGTPIYRSYPKDKFVDPHMAEYYVHTDNKHFNFRFLFEHWRL